MNLEISSRVSEGVNSVFKLVPSEVLIAILTELLVCLELMGEEVAATSLLLSLVVLLLLFLREKMLVLLG